MTKLGDFELAIVSDGTVRFDGGAMFGVVPRVVWEKLFPPDDINRVTCGLNNLLVRTGADNILIDTGIGDKGDEKFNKRYGITHETSVPKSLASLGLEATDITMVINTHLHFDHAGWNTSKSGDSFVPTFANARYIVQRGEYEHACAPNERDRASYLPANWEAIEKSGQLELVDGDCEIVPGVKVIKVPGHNRDSQCVRIDSGGETAFFFADVMPTTAHVHLAWTMGFDLYPVELVEQKKQLIPQAIRENWLCVFFHDQNTPMGRLTETNGKVAVML